MTSHPLSWAGARFIVHSSDRRARHSHTPTFVRPAAAGSPNASSHPFGWLEGLYSILETLYSRTLNISWRRGRDWLRFAPGLRPNPADRLFAHAGSPNPVFSSLRPARSPILHTRDSILSYVKVSWRRGRDSNPRNLAVHLISNQTQSTTLPPLLTRTIEEVRGSPAGKRKVPGPRLEPALSVPFRGRDVIAITSVRGRTYAGFESG